MIENIKSQMRKGILEFCILSVVSQREVYATEILDTLKEASLIVQEGTLYPLLTRLKNSGILCYRWEESKSGPPRKYFSLTEEGNQLLHELTGEWKAMQTSIEKIQRDIAKKNNATTNTERQ